MDKGSSRCRSGGRHRNRLHAALLAVEFYQSLFVTATMRNWTGSSFELLKIALDRPHLVDFAGRRPDPNKQREYDAYAFMIWNFAETVFDRCQGWGKKSLRTTWYPVVAAENALHRKWFDLPEPASLKRGFANLSKKNTRHPKSKTRTFLLNPNHQPRWLQRLPHASVTI